MRQEKNHNFWKKCPRFTQRRQAYKEESKGSQVQGSTFRIRDKDRTDDVPNEILSRRTSERRAASSGPDQAQSEKPSERGWLGEMLWGTKRRQGMVETVAKQAARTVGSQIGRQIIRGVLRGILGGSRRH